VTIPQVGVAPKAMKPGYSGVRRWFHTGMYAVRVPSVSGPSMPLNSRIACLPDRLPETCHSSVSAEGSNASVLRENNSTLNAL